MKTTTVSKLLLSTTLLISACPEPTPTPPPALTEDLLPVSGRESAIWIDELDYTQRACQLALNAQGQIARLARNKLSILEPDAAGKLVEIGQLSSHHGGCPVAKLQDKLYTLGNLDALNVISLSDPSAPTRQQQITLPRTWGPHIVSTPQALTFYSLETGPGTVNVTTTDAQGLLTPPQTLSLGTNGQLQLLLAHEHELLITASEDSITNPTPQKILFYVTKDANGQLVSKQLAIPESQWENIISIKDGKLLMLERPNQSPSKLHLMDISGAQTSTVAELTLSSPTSPDDRPGQEHTVSLAKAYALPHHLAVLLRKQSGQTHLHLATLDGQPSAQTFELLTSGALTVESQSPAHLLLLSQDNTSNNTGEATITLFDTSAADAQLSTQLTIAAPAALEQARWQPAQTHTIGAGFGAIATSDMTTPEPYLLVIPSSGFDPAQQRHVVRYHLYTYSETTISARGELEMRASDTPTTLVAQAGANKLLLSNEQESALLGQNAQGQLQKQDLRYTAMSHRHVYPMGDWMVRHHIDSEAQHSLMLLPKAEITAQTHAPQGLIFGRLTGLIAHKDVLISVERAQDPAPPHLERDKLSVIGLDETTTPASLTVLSTLYVDDLDSPCIGCIDRIAANDPASNNEVWDVEAHSIQDRLLLRDSSGQLITIDLSDPSAPALEAPHRSPFSSLQVRQDGDRLAFITARQKGTQRDDHKLSFLAEGQQGTLVQGPEISTQGHVLAINDDTILTTYRNKLYRQRITNGAAITEQELDLGDRIVVSAQLISETRALVHTQSPQASVATNNDPMPIAEQAHLLDLETLTIESTQTLPATGALLRADEARSFWFINSALYILEHAASGPEFTAPLPFGQISYLDDELYIAAGAAGVHHFTWAELAAMLP